jgi:hypothetical protein
VLTLPCLQMVLHLLNIIGPRASVFDPWKSHVTVNAMLSALELENDITVLQSLFLIVHPLSRNEPDECFICSPETGCTPEPK